MSTTLTTSQFEQVKRLLRVLFDGALEDGVYELTCHPTSRLESSGESLVEVR